MSATFSIDIFCDKCGNWENFLCRKISVARRQARDKGWLRKSINGELCDFCSACNVNFDLGTLADDIIM